MLFLLLALAGAAIAVTRRQRQRRDIGDTAGGADHDFPDVVEVLAASEQGVAGVDDSTSRLAPVLPTPVPGNFDVLDDFELGFEFETPYLGGLTLQDTETEEQVRLDEAAASIAAGVDDSTSRPAVLPTPVPGALDVLWPDTDSSDELDLDFGATGVDLEFTPTIKALTVNKHGMIITTFGTDQIGETNCDPDSDPDEISF